MNIKRASGEDSEGMKTVHGNEGKTILFIQWQKKKKKKT